MRDIILNNALASNGLEQMDNKRSFLALNRMDQMGPRRILKLLNRWPHLEDMFRLSRAGLIQAGLPEKMAQAISVFDWDCLDEDLQWEMAFDHYLLTWSDPAYPALLKEIDDPPMVLYVKGDLSCLRQRTISIVGTRNPSVTGRETARRFAFDLAGHNLTIVSGLALGVDAAAHQGCLEASGKTIAVMGTGVDCIYPRQHVKLAERICENGLLMSEFPLHTEPFAGHFPRRNRIISGLSSATLVVEAAIRSGSLITARFACEQNRDVLAIPGSIHNPQSRGCHHLLQQGATLVTSSADVLSGLGLDSDPIPVVESPNTLADGDKNLVQCIGFETTTVDQMVLRSGLAHEFVVCSLADLELQGQVLAVPGGYTRCI